MTLKCVSGGFQMRCNLSPVLLVLLNDRKEAHSVCVYISRCLRPAGAQETLTLFLQLISDSQMTLMPHSGGTEALFCLSIWAKTGGS
jgi:hypothetical protein